MEKIMKCPRCHNRFIMNGYLRMGVCRWCEEDLIMLDRELSRKCGLYPMSRLDAEELNKYWRKKKA